MDLSLPGEKHYLKVPTADGYKRPNFLGPGTQYKARIAMGAPWDTPVDPYGIDATAKIHDMEYTAASDERTSLMRQPVTPQRQLEIDRGFETRIQKADRAFVDTINGLEAPWAYKVLLASLLGVKMMTQEYTPLTALRMHEWVSKNPHELRRDIPTAVPVTPLTLAMGSQEDEISSLLRPTQPYSTKPERKTRSEAGTRPAAGFTLDETRLGLPGDTDPWYFAPWTPPEPSKRRKRKKHRRVIYR
jgi:hypothetical protein